MIIAMNALVAIIKPALLNSKQGKLELQNSKCLSSGDENFRHKLISYLVPRQYDDVRSIAGYNPTKLNRDSSIR
jgi:hypothetical protein